MPSILGTAGPVAINEFDGPYAFLSNFYPWRGKNRIPGAASPVILGDDLTYPSGEHAFQAQKTLSRDERARIAVLPTPGEAKAAGRRVRLRGDWEDIKKQVMLRVVLEKFRRNPELMRQLCATSHAVLVEGNTWHDQYWGDCCCGERAVCRKPGLNYLGTILTSVRAVLRED